MSKPTHEVVNEQWTGVLIKKGLPLDLMDEPGFRKAVLKTAQAGLAYVDAQKGETRLPIPIISPWASGPWWGANKNPCPTPKPSGACGGQTPNETNHNCV